MRDIIKSVTFIKLLLVEICGYLMAVPVTGNAALRLPCRCAKITPGENYLRATCAVLDMAVRFWSSAGR
jgi:hypothetical protein